MSDKIKGMEYYYYYILYEKRYRILKILKFRYQEKHFTSKCKVDKKNSVFNRDIENNITLFDSKFIHRRMDV